MWSVCFVARIMNIGAITFVYTNKILAIEYIQQLSSPIVSVYFFILSVSRKTKIATVRVKYMAMVARDRKVRQWPVNDQNVVARDRWIRSFNTSKCQDVLVQSVAMLNLLSRSSNLWSFRGHYWTIPVQYSANMGHRLTKGTLRQNLKIWKWWIFWKCHPCRAIPENSNDLSRKIKKLHAFKVV